MASKSENRRINLYINGKEVRNNIKSIRNEYFKLVNAQSRMTRGTKEYYQAAKEIKKLKGMMAEHNKQLGRMGKMWGNLKTLIFGVVGGNLITSFFQKITSFIPDMIKRNGDLSDSFADVAKTTGLTVDQVQDLNKELKKIDTRSSRKELLDLARIAGKLGVRGKADILGFVKAGDQINVALSEDLGGNAAEAIRQIGKLTDVFKLKDKFGLEESLLKTGSAINALGAASTANEQFLVEFTKRVAGVAPMADISIESVLGLGATLDQLGQTSEVSSTVFSQVIPNMFKDTATYAGVAGIGVGKFSELLKTDANEAFIKVLEGLNGNNAGMETMVNKLNELGLGGKRTISVLGVLSNNTEMLRDQQKLANVEFEKGTSLTNEFNIKNKTVGANLAKIGKKLAGIFVNSKLLSGIEKVVGLFADWIDIPVSKQLEDQRIEANLLTIELTNANTTAQRRNDIYIELQSISPKIVEGIDAENISTEKLRSNLARYNDEMIKKIAIQESEETLQKKREEYGEKIGSRIVAENKLSKELFKLKEKVGKFDETRANKINDILLSDKDILEKEAEIQGIVEAMNKETKTNFVLATRAYNAAYDVKGLKGEELELQKELNTALQEYQDIYNRVFGNSPGGVGNKESSNKTMVEDPYSSKGGGTSNSRSDSDKIEGMQTLAATEIDILDDKLTKMEERESEYASAIAEKHKWTAKEKINALYMYGYAAQDLTDSLMKFNTAAMNHELKEAGDNESRRTAIKEKYANKEKQIGIAQATISGALGILRIWETKSPLPSPAAEIYKGVQTGALIARTDANIALMNSQSFAQGGFTQGAAYYQAGEAGQEYIAPNWQLNHPVTGPIIKGLEQMRLGKSSEIIRETNTEKTFTDPFLLAMLQRLEEKLNEPSKAYLVADEDYIDTHEKTMNDYNEFKNTISG